MRWYSAEAVVSVRAGSEEEARAAIERAFSACSERLRGLGVSLEVDFGSLVEEGDGSA